MPFILSSFITYQPQNEVPQDRLGHWMSKVYSLTSPDTFDERFIQKFAIKEDKIEKRSFFCSDIGRSSVEGNILFNKENKFLPSIEARSQFYRKTVDDIFHFFFQDRHNPPGEILHVTCTGYHSPSPGQKIIPENQWGEITGITHMYHMGCYAAMPAIKVAKGMRDKVRVDIVHTEICSNHFDTNTQSPEQTVVQTLFADGAIKYSGTFTESSSPDSLPGLKVLEMKENIIPHTEQAMTWGLGNHHFEMTLHRNVPGHIKEHIKDYTKDLFDQCGLDYEKEKENTIFAIHPGGPKIIDNVKKTLDLNEDQLRHSKKILRERGNMSSATLPHVWKEILEDPSIERGTKILSVAFGPGLTVAGFMGEKV